MYLSNSPSTAAAFTFYITILPPTDPFSQTHQTVMVESSGTRRIVPSLLTHSLSNEVASLIRNTIQGLENKLKTLEQEMILCILVFLLLLGVWLSFNIVVLILILFPISGILATIDSYTSCKDAYQKLKEQEESGQIKCPACKEGTAVLVKKQNSKFIVCKRRGFTWRSNNFVVRRILEDFLSIWSPDQLKEPQLQSLNELYHYLPGETIDLLQYLKANAESRFKKAKDKKKGIIT